MVKVKTFQIGDKVALKSRGKWHYGEVKSVRENESLVWWIPQRWNNTWQTWVSNKRLVLEVSENQAVIDAG